MADLAIRGADQLRALGADLRRAGSPGRGVRSKLRRNLKVAALPVKKAVQANALAIPSAGTGHTGLRSAIAKATQIKILTAGKNPTVRVWVNPKRMPAGQQGLPALMEGLAPWRHPLFGNRGSYYPQQSHPYASPAVPVAVIAATKAAIEAIEETAAEVERGI